MSLLEYCLFHSSIGMVEGGRTARGCLGAFSLGASSSSSAGSASSFFLGASLGLVADSFLGAASFFGAIVRFGRKEDTCVLSSLLDEVGGSHDFDVGFEIADQSPESNNIGVFSAVFGVKQLLSDSEPSGCTYWKPRSR